MGCGCGKKNLAGGKFVYITAEGKQRTYNTEVEAKAAQIRAGGQGEVKPA